MTANEGGVPYELLKKSEGNEKHIITVETSCGDVYLGNLLEVERNMTLHMKNVKATMADGKILEMKNICLKGSRIRLIGLPENANEILQDLTKQAFRGGRGGFRGGSGKRGGRFRDGGSGRYNGGGQSRDGGDGRHDGRERSRYGGGGRRDCRERSRDDGGGRRDGRERSRDGGGGRYHGDGRSRDGSSEPPYQSYYDQSRC